MLTNRPAVAVPAVDEIHIVQADMGRRAYAWGPSTLRAIVQRMRTGFGRRFSVLGCLSTDGFEWQTVELHRQPNPQLDQHKSVDAALFLEMFRGVAEPLMGPFPGPNSIVTLDGAGVHTAVWAELEEICARHGAVLKRTPVSPTAGCDCTSAPAHLRLRKRKDLGSGGGRPAF